MNYNIAFLYCDSTLQAIQDTKSDLYYRTVLLKGFIHEKVELYDQAFEYYTEVYDYYLTHRPLVANEELILLMGMMRINFMNSQDPQHYILQAKELTHKDPSSSDLEPLWNHQSVIEKDKDKKIEYSKKALEYYQQKGSQHKIFASLCTLSENYLHVNSDSCWYDLQKGARFLHKKKDTFSSLNRLFYRCTYADYLSSQHKYSDAINYARETLEFPNINTVSSYCTHLTLAKLYQNIDNYREALKHTTEANNFRINNFRNNSYTKVQLLIEKEEIRDIQRESREFKLTAEITALKNAVIITALCFILLFLFYVLGVLNKSKIKQNALTLKIKEIQDTTQSYKQNLQTIKEHIENEDNKSVIVDGVKTQIEKYKSSNEWELFISEIIITTPDIMAKVVRRFQKFTNKERQFFLCLYFDLPIPRMAQVLNIREVSIRAMQSKVCQKYGSKNKEAKKKIY